MSTIDPSEFLQAVADSIDGVEVEELSLSMNLKDVPNWDSLARLSVVAELEDRFGVTLGLGDLAKCGTLEELRSFVEKGQSS